MATTFKAKTRSLVVVGGLLLLISLASASVVQAATALSAEESYWLTYMRQEEKLARDVYQSLYNKWGLAIFDNISQSEQTHMDVIDTLLGRYGVQYSPTEATCDFSNNASLESLCIGLIEEGSASQAAALEKGVTIEETDIADLTTAISRTTHKDILKVYSNLLLGSKKHLAAFQLELAK